MNPKALLFLSAGAALLTMMFVAFKPDALPPVQDQAPAGAAAGPAGAAMAEPRKVEWVIREGKLQGGPPVIALRQDEELALRVTSDRADELHLHGYDISLKLHPGAAAELRFRATRSGRFEVELHHAHAELGAVEVQPR